MANLHEDDSEVMKEQESIDQRNCKRYDIVVMMIFALNYSDDVKKPEAKSEYEDEKEDEGSEHEDAGERGFREAVETSPKPEEEEEEFEREGDQKSLAFRIAGHGDGGGG